MKQKRISLSVLMVLVAFVLVACGRKAQGIVGRWEAKSARAYGMSVDIEERINAEIGMDVEGAMTMEIAENSECSFAFMGQSMDGTWTKEDGKYVFDIDGEQLEGTIDDGQLVISMESNGETIDFVFEKSE